MTTNIFIDGTAGGSGGSGNATSIQGVAVSATAPTDGYVLTYVAANTDWEAKPASSGTFTAPTGTGLMTTTSGTMNTAASTVGTGVLTFLGTPSSANFASMMTDETGTGSVMLGTSPTVKTSLIINNPANTFAYTLTPSAITAARALTLPLLTADDTLVTLAATQTLTNKTIDGSTNTLTNVAISTAVSGLATGVATFLGTPSSANLAAAITDETGSGKLVFGTSPNFTTSLSVGTTPAAAGAIRLANAASVNFNNAGGTADVTAMIVDASNNLFVGSSDSGTLQAATVRIAPSSGIIINAAGSGSLYLDGTAINSYQPLIGISSPYGAHGVGVQAMADANQTTTLYIYNTIATTGAITANRNLTLPTATDVAGYTKIIDNRCTGAFSIVVTTGAGTTVTVANGSIITVLVDSRGVTQVGVAASSGGSFTAPTGTGLMTTTSGTMDTAATAVGTGALTFLGTPSSANLAAMLTDETGTGAAVFGTTPTFKTSVLINNPANTFAYTLTPAAITAARTLNLPLITATDTLVVTTLAQTLTSKTLTSPVLTTPQINNPALTFQYLVAGSAITADRTVTLPLLAGNDVFTFNDATQTLTAKTLTSPVLGGTPNISAATAITSGNAKGVETDRYPVNVSTTDATVTTLDSFTIASGSMVAVNYVVSCIQSTSATAGCWSVSAVFKNNAGTVTQVGTTQVTIMGTDDAAYTATINNSTTTIRVQVTGKAATTLQWSCFGTVLTVVP